MSSTITFGLVLVSVLWLGIPETTSVSDAVCDQWHDTAQSVAGDRRFHTCTNNRTAICTRFDCEGSLFENVFSHSFEVDYCFGLVLNSCLEPLSMDFYLNIPSHNFSQEYRISHDQVVTLPIKKGLFGMVNNIPIVKEFHLQPLLDFEFERDGQNEVVISITFKVKSTILPIFFDQLQKTIAKEERLPIEPCSQRINDTANRPPKSFNSVPCHIDKFPWMKKPTLVRPAAKVDPSATLNRTCSISQPCSVGESCELTSDGKGMCHCEPDYKYSPSVEACVSQGSVGSECLRVSDCGIYEVCTKDSASSTGFVCACESSFRWHTKRQLCVLDTGTDGNSTSTDNHSSGNNSKPNSSGHTDKDGAHDKPSSANTKYMVIGGVSVAVAILVAVVIVGFLFIRRRRRRNRFPEGNGLYDSHTPMLSDVDDDVDLIM